MSAESGHDRKEISRQRVVVAELGEPVIVGDARNGGEHPQGGAWCKVAGGAHILCSWVLGSLLQAQAVFLPLTERHFRHGGVFNRYIVLPFAAAVVKRHVQSKLQAPC